METTMTEDRFEIIETKSDNHIAVLDTNDMTTHQMIDCGVAKDVCILLNELNEENEQLQEQIKKLNLKMTRDLNDFLRK